VSLGENVAIWAIQLIREPLGKAQKNMKIWIKLVVVPAGWRQDD
jgi:hypothetical protein